ncbi:MAG: YveK family protein [Thermomicrobiales bacterium]
MEIQQSAGSRQHAVLRTQYSSLPRFWAVVRRRWPVLVILPLIALGLAAYNYRHTAKTYTASGEATVTSIAPDPTSPQGFDNYYRALASEAATDDLTRLVPGSTFARAVAKRLQAKGENYSAGEVQGALSATRVYRVLSVVATAGDPTRAVQIGQAALDELAANGPTYFPNRPVQLTITNYPTGAGAKALKAGVLAAGTFLAGALLAAAIALLVDLFDTRLHDRQEIEDQLGLPVVGIIPRRARSGRGV